jgi:hypothetical protein
MLALIAAFLIALAAFGVDFGKVDLFLLGLAFWAAHFGVAVPVPSFRRG